MIGISEFVEFVAVTAVIDIKISPIKKINLKFNLIILPPMIYYNI